MKFMLKSTLAIHISWGHCDPAKIVFYPNYFSEMIWKHFCLTLLVIRMRLICKRVRNDPKNREYMDLSLEPVIENETESLELFQSEAAKKFVEKRHRFEKMRHSVTPTS